MEHPILIFGTGFLGVSFPSVNETEELLQFLQSHGLYRIDTARRYPAIKPGRSEQLLGEAKAVENGFVIDTKIKVSPVEGLEGSLKAEKIDASTKESFESLGAKQVGLVMSGAVEKIG